MSSLSELGLLDNWWSRDLVEDLWLARIRDQKPRDRYPDENREQYRARLKKEGVAPRKANSASSLFGGKSGVFAKD